MLCSRTAVSSQNVLSLILLSCPGHQDQRFQTPRRNPFLPAAHSQVIFVVLRNFVQHQGCTSDLLEATYRWKIFGFRCQKTFLFSEPPTIIFFRFLLQPATKRSEMFQTLCNLVQYHTFHPPL